MKFPVLLVPEVNDDLLEGIVWYNDQKDDLGNQFYNAVVATVNIISSNPLLFALKVKSIRSASVKRFPFIIYYKFEKSQQKVVVLAILHQSRNPKIWKDRG